MSSSHLHHYGRLASAESRSASSLVPVAGRYIRAITDGYQWKGAILRHLDGSGHGGSVQDLPLPRVGRAGDSRLPLQQGPPLVERRQQGPVERLVDERVDDPLDLLPLENEDDLVCRKVDGMTVETVLVRVERRAFRDELGRALLRPAQRDHVGVHLLGHGEDLLRATADPQLERHLVETPWAVAGEELLAPRLRLMLRLVGERGQRLEVVDVQGDDVEVRVLCELDDRLRCD